MRFRWELRAALALLVFGLWLTLLFFGVGGWGAVHLLLAASLFLFPWRAGLAPVEKEG
jgi:hypothetical protein